MPQNHIILGPENVAVKGQTKNSHGDYGEDSDLLLDSGGSQRKKSREVEIMMSYFNTKEGRICWHF